VPRRLASAGRQALLYLVARICAILIGGLRFRLRCDWLAFSESRNRLR